MMENFTLERMMLVVVYAIGLGVSIKAVALTCRYFWNIKTSPREGGLLVGALLAYMVVFGIHRGPLVASTISALVIVGYFFIKLLKKYTDG